MPILQRWRNASFVIRILSRYISSQKIKTEEDQQSPMLLDWIQFVHLLAFLLTRLGLIVSKFTIWASISISMVMGFIFHGQSEASLPPRIKKVWRWTTRGIKWECSARKYNNNLPLVTSIRLTGCKPSYKWWANNNRRRLLLKEGTTMLIHELHREYAFWYRMNKGCDNIYLV